MEEVERIETDLDDLWQQHEEATYAIEVLADPEFNMEKLEKEITFLKDMLNQGGGDGDDENAAAADDDDDDGDDAEADGDDDDGDDDDDDGGGIDDDDDDDDDNNDDAPENSHS